eukprot:8991054-Pyramimonas_sp.AAC.1
MALLTFLPCATPARSLLRHHLPLETSNPEIVHPESRTKLQISPDTPARCDEICGNRSQT